VPLAKVRATRDGLNAAIQGLELLGGNGYMEDWPMARQLRDAQCHTIWEGTENICCLDVRRAIQREAAHEVAQEAMNAGVWVFGGGLESQGASVVATNGTVSDGPYPEAVGGFWVVDVPSREEALKWAAKTAAACRCAQEVREFGPDPAVGN